LNARDVNGWTALMSAAFDGSAALIDALLQAGADATLVSSEGKKAIDYAQYSLEGTDIYWRLNDASY
jgi:ankyrin repeat protein